MEQAPTRRPACPIASCSSPRRRASASRSWQRRSFAADRRALIRPRRRPTRSARTTATCGPRRAALARRLRSRRRRSASAFRVDLTPDTGQRGFDRLFVLGVRLSADEDDRAAADSRSCSTTTPTAAAASKLLPAGARRRTTPRTPAPATRRGDDADASFDERLPAAGSSSAEATARREVRRPVAGRAAGHRPAGPRARSRGSGGLRPARRRARCRRALWPATLGYCLETLTGARLRATTTSSTTRGFFTRYVSGRGSAPGRPHRRVSPTGSCRPPRSRRIALARPAGRRRACRAASRVGFLLRLHAILLGAVEPTGRTMAAAGAVVGRPGDAHQSLLGILGLHPASAEFHYRYAESLQHLFNRLNRPRHSART